MSRRTKLIIIIMLSIVLGLLYISTSTYSVIINAREDNGVIKIVNQIRIRDLLTTSGGEYNQTYYDVMSEINITNEEADILMNSDRLNENLQIVLNSVANYKIKNNDNYKLSSDQIYNLILDGLNNTDNLSLETRDKLLDKSSMYLNDIIKFLYDIEVNNLGGI